MKTRTKTRSEIKPPDDARPRRAWRVAHPRAMVLAAGVLCMLLSVSRGDAQHNHHGKIPGLSKIESNGPTRGAFTGNIETMNRKQRVIDVSTADGQSSAMFPLSKKVKISSIEGRKLKLAALTAGESVIVYYEQQGARRTVQKIVIVKQAPKKKTKAS